MMFNRTLFRELFGDEDFMSISPADFAFGVTTVFIMLPIQTILNKCFKEDVKATERYELASAFFLTDYDRENPVTKKEGMKRIMEKRKAIAGT
jgi:hypothetical protein